jgi:hypothetical protein
MRFSFLALSLLLVPQQAPADSSASSEDMIIHGESVVAKKRGDLERKLRRLGYDKFVRKDGRTLVRHRTAYKPTVVIDDDGWMTVKRSPIRIDPPGKRDNKLRYLWCLPPFTITPLCIKVGGQTVSRRRLQSHKTRVIQATQGYASEWRTAVISLAMDSRLGRDIPNMLDSIWVNGHTGEQDSLMLASHAERRAALLQFWAGRSCIKEGAQARELVHDFITYEVQPSAHPASAAEIRAANQAQRCSDAIPLPIPPDP